MKNNINGASGHAIVIDGTQHEWEPQFITGRQVRELGNIEEEADLYLERKPDKEKPVEDEDRVNLAGAGAEHFISRVGDRVITLIIDGTPKVWDKKKISFKEVIILAFGEYIDKPTMVYTVAYEDGPKQNPEGSMKKGSQVFVKDKMIFHATATDKS